MQVRQLTLEDVTFEVIPHNEDLPLDGAFDSGDPEYVQADKNLEAELQRRLDEGDIWAWCEVEVKASITLGQCTFTESSYLGGCSYAHEQEFMQDGYYPDLQADALEALNLKIQTLADSLSTLAV